MSDWNADGVNDRWPLFYDNYFVPRGYAYVLAQMNGTGYTEQGCPMHGGPTDIAGEKSVVDWLNGRTVAYKAKAGSLHDARPRGARRGHLAQRLLGHDRQVLRRHAGQRRRRHGRRGPQDDRPDLAPSPLGTTTRAAAASARTRTTRAARLNPTITYSGTPPNGHARRQPAEPPDDAVRRRSTRTSATTPTWTPATVTPTATSTRSGATATTTRTPARSRRPSSSSTASRTTTSRWTRSACGGTP